MNKKEQQAQRAKQEDVVLNKVLWWIVGAVVLEVLLLLLNKVYANYTVEQIELAKSLRDVFSVLMIALPICFVVLLIWAVAARKSGKFTRLSSVLAGVMLALAVCAVVIRVFDESGKSGHTGLPVPLPPQRPGSSDRMPCRFAVRSSAPASF